MAKEVSIQIAIHCPGMSKEIHFFDNEKNFNPVNYKKYHVLFPLPNKVPKGNLIFEATPSYIYNPKAAERIFKYNPDLKIIICLRREG